MKVDMEPIHKFNNGNGATLCNACHVIIETGLTKVLLCNDCSEWYNELRPIFDSKHGILQAVKEIAEDRIKELTKKT